MTTERLPLPLLMTNVVRPVVDAIFHDHEVNRQAGPTVHFMVVAIEAGQPLTAGQFATNMTARSSPGSPTICTRWPR